LEGESFKILCFGQGCNDGVIKALGMAVDHPQGSFAVNGRALHAVEKEFSGCVMGTAECRENSTLVQHAEGPEMDFLVSTHGVLNGLFIPGEGWGIENNEIVSFIVLP
jgi:hypothetical protein